MTGIIVASFKDLPDGGATRVDVGGRRLSVIRIDQSVYVIGDRCTHADVSLSEGEVDVDTCHIECWKHGSSFSLVTGEPDAFPATRPVPVYEAHVLNGDVVVTLPEPTEDGANV